MTFNVFNENEDGTFAQDVTTFDALDFDDVLSQMSEKGWHGWSGRRYFIAKARPDNVFEDGIIVTYVPPTRKPTFERA